MPDQISFEPGAQSGGGVTSVSGTGLVSVTAGSTPVVSLVSGAQNLVVATPSGSSGVPTERALVAADLPMTGVTAGAYTNPSVTFNAAGQATAASSGASYAARLCFAFESGGTLSQWQAYPIGGVAAATYLQFPASEPVGMYDFPLLRSSSGGTYTVSFIYTINVNILISIRTQASLGGSWSTTGTHTILSSNGTDSFTVSLTAGQSLGLHFAPVGGTVIITFLEVFL